MKNLKAEEARKARIAERERHEAEERQREIEYKLHLQLQEQQHSRDMERIEAQRSARPVPVLRDKIRARTPKIPAFYEGKHEMDSYWLRFERYATAQGWDKGTCATDSALLQGKALCVYGLMPKEDALDYDKLKW